jgi:excisionase family DNA binding protein
MLLLIPLCGLIDLGGGNMKDVYSPSEVAEILGVHVKTVRRYLNEGTLKGLKVGGAWKVSKEEVKKMLNHVDDEDKIKDTSRIRKNLSIEVDINDIKEGKTIAKELMELINSDNYENCTFNFNQEGKTSFFKLTGNTDYLIDSLKVIKKYES